MEKYNYYEAMKEDIKNYIAENYTAEELQTELLNLDNFRENLYDALWIEDSVTGNGSGSYPFNRQTAKNYIFSNSDNMELLTEALKNFCVDSETIAKKFLSEDWEYFDATIRSDILGGVLYCVLYDLKGGTK